LLLDGSHNPNTMMAEKAVLMIITLKRPIRSAIIPGIMRPKML
jgi:hypothetical protein